MDDVISEENVMENRLALIGQLYQNPKVNIQAFHNTMKRVWRVENVDINLLTPGMFGFHFFSKMDRDRGFEPRPLVFCSPSLAIKALGA